MFRLAPKVEEAPLLKSGVALEGEVVEGGRVAVDLDAHAELVEDDVVGEQLAADGVLRIDPVAVAAVGAVEAGVINDVAVGLGVRGVRPHPDRGVGVVDDQVDELRARR